MTIKHIVITGGGPSGLVSYGALKNLHNSGFWTLSDIQSIHATSVGGIISAIILLDYEWDWLDDYFIKRPWEKILDEFMCADLLTILSNKGLDSRIFVSYILEPLLKAKDISLNISLIDFYNKTNIDLTLYATDLNTNYKMTQTSINKDTFPQMSLVDAVAITMAFPFIFKPIFIDKHCFIDGGVLNNFPLNVCIKNNCNPDEVLAIKNKYHPCQNITDDIALLDFIRLFITKVHTTLDSNSYEFSDIPYLVVCDVGDVVNFDMWIKALNNQEFRDYLINAGVSSSKTFIDSISKTEFIVKN
jgi:predicted acylesterase/phospholipase RssA